MAKARWDLENVTSPGLGLLFIHCWATVGEKLSTWIQHKPVICFWGRRSGQGPVGPSLPLHPSQGPVMVLTTVKGSDPRSAMWLLSVTSF